MRLSLNTFTSVVFASQSLFSCSNFDLSKTVVKLGTGLSRDPSACGNTNGDRESTKIAAAINIETMLWDVLVMGLSRIERAELPEDGMDFCEGKLTRKESIGAF